jgi:drug/metabolite transporter (DMT)-like permease
MSQLTGFLAAFLTLFCWTIGTFSFTKASKLYSPNSVNRVRLLYACILLSIITCFFVKINPIQLFTKPALMQWVWLGISGIVGLSIGDFFAFTAFKLIGSSKTSLFNSFAPAAALVGGYFLLNEQINVIGMIGMIVSVLGVFLFIKINSDSGNQKLDSPAKGLLFAFLGAVCQGIGLVFAKMGLSFNDFNQELISPIHATWIRLFVATVFIYFTGFYKRGLWQELKDISTQKTLLKPIVIGTFFGPVLGVTMSLFAASILEVSLAQTIFSFLPISVIAFSFFLNSESIKLKSIFVALLSICGVFILMWRAELQVIFNEHVKPFLFSFF